MRTLDLSPLFRSTVGFDRMTSLLETATRMDTNAANTYPPYNIERQSEDAYRISMAVAGFTLDDLEIEVQDQAVTVRGRQSDAHSADDENTTYLHRGIATRAFERRFHLADHIRVSGAKLEHGLLHVELVREVPEALRPRMIEIASGADARSAAKVIEGETSKDEKAATKAA
jgi:molecular chaperone IbpA